MGKLKILPWDPAEHIETEEDMALSLSVALEDDDPRLLLATLNDIARAKQSIDGARSLADELPLDGKTDIATVLKAVPRPTARKDCSWQALSTRSNLHLSVPPCHGLPQSL